MNLKTLDAIDLFVKNSKAAVAFYSTILDVSIWYTGLMPRFTIGEQIFAIREPNVGETSSTQIQTTFTFITDTELSEIVTKLKANSIKHLVVKVEAGKLYDAPVAIRFKDLDSNQIVIRNARDKFFDSYLK